MRGAGAGLGICAIVVLLSPDAHASKDAAACIAAAEQSQPLRAAGHLRAARELLLVCERDDCPTVVRTDCRTWLAELEAEQPSIIVRTVDAQGKALADVPVTLDGEVFVTHPDDPPRVVDPGEHRLRAELPGRAAADTTLRLQPGERGHVVTLVLVPAPVVQAPEQAVPTPSPSPPAPAVAEGPAPPPARRPSARHVPTVAWGVGGAGVVAVAAGATLWAVGLVERGGLYAGCGRTPERCTQGDVNAARFKLLAGDIAFGAGLLATGAGVWVALRSGANGSSRPSTSALGFAPAPSGGLVMYGRTF